MPGSICRGHGQGRAILLSGADSDGEVTAGGNPGTNDVAITVFHRDEASRFGTTG